MEGAEPLARVDSPLDRAVVLFHDVVQIRTGATATPPAQFPFRLQFRNHLRVRWVAVHIDDSGTRVAGSAQGSLEEALRCERITLSGKQKINGGAGGIDGAV